MGVKQRPAAASYKNLLRKTIAKKKSVAPHLLPRYCPPSPRGEVIYRPLCPGIGYMDPKQFAFYTVTDRSGKKWALQGYRSCRGYLFRNLGFNLFELGDMKIPPHAKKVKPPPRKWISEFFFDKMTNRLTRDPSFKMPKNARGKAYRIEGGNNEMEVVAYVRKDAVSLFRRPDTSYNMDPDEDLHFIFEVDRLYYTEEVVTFRNPRKVWIGIDEEYKRHGWLGFKNPSCEGCQMLVQLSSKRYAFIGRSVFTFTSPQQVTAFYCELVGDSASPWTTMLTSSTVMFTPLEKQVKRKEVEPLVTAGIKRSAERRFTLDAGDWSRAYKLLNDQFNQFRNRTVGMNIVKRIHMGH